MLSSKTPTNQDSITFEMFLQDNSEVTHKHRAASKGFDCNVCS